MIFIQLTHRSQRKINGTLDFNVHFSTGAWRFGTVSSRHHDNRYQHHHQLSTSSSTNTLVHCQQDEDCRQPNDALKGDETCHFLYEGCSVGICMCDPLNQKKHPQTGKCIPGEDMTRFNLIALICFQLVQFSLDICRRRRNR